MIFAHEIFPNFLIHNILTLRMHTALQQHERKTHVFLKVEFFTERAFHIS